MTIKEFNETFNNLEEAIILNNAEKDLLNKKKKACEQKDKELRQQLVELVLDANLLELYDVKSRLLNLC